MAIRIQLRRDSASNWASANPVLALGEPGYDTTNEKLKIGDGVTAWNSLPYAASTDWNDLTNTPTTLGGYSITDAATSAQGALADSAIQPDDSPQLTNLTLTGYLAGPSTFIIDPAILGNDTGTLRVRGSLQVDGNTVDIAALGITLANGAANSAAADGAGIQVDGADASITYQSSDDSWVFNKTIQGTQLKIDNLDLNGNTISSTDTNGNIILAPDGSGAISANTSKIINLADPESANDAVNLQYLQAETELTVGDGLLTQIVNLTDGTLNIVGGNDITASVIKVGDVVTVTLDNDFDLDQDVSTTDSVTFASVTVDNTTINNNTISTTANNNLTLTAGGTGEVIINTLSVSDLTSGRMVFVGTTGALVDNANLAYNSSTNTLTVDGVFVADNININGNTISSTNTNGNINLTPDGSGEVVASTLTVSDLTDNRVVLAGTSGALQDNSNLTFNGTTLTVTGSIAVDNITLDANTISTSSGNLTLTSTGGEVTATSLAVSDLTSGRIVLAGTSGALEDNANLTYDGSLFTVGGDILPATTDTYDLGSSSVRWQDLHLNGTLTGPATFIIDPAAIGDNTGKVIIAGDLQVDGTTTTINSTTLTVDDLNIVLASGAASAAAANGAGITIDGANATLTYDSSDDEFDFNKGITAPSATISGTATLNGIVFGASGINSDDSSAINFLTGVNFSSDISVGGNITPTSQNIDIGSSSARWQELYLTPLGIDINGARVTESGGVINIPALSTIDGAVISSVDEAVAFAVALG